MLIKEFEFQQDAIAELVDKAEKNIDIKNDNMLFTAPVASGKTVMAGRFMNMFFKEHPEYAFVWLTPGTGELEEQSKRKIDSMSLDIKPLNLQDALVQRELLPGDALFVNWELLNANNKAMNGGEQDGIKEVMEKSDVKMIALVDEAHHTATTDNSQAKLDVFSPELIIHITATPSDDYPLAVQKVEVDIHDVIEMGLIKKQVIINKDLKSLEQEDILKRAIEKIDSLKARFATVDRDHDLPPLCLVQIQNDTNVEKDGASQRESERIHAMLLELGVPEDKIAIKLASKEVNYQNIDTSNVEYLIMKQAVATGWDCPRAHVLVRFRDVKSPTFDIQTIGRILRTTEAKHYVDDLLDSAYIFTEFDQVSIEGNVQSRGRVVTSKEMVALKPEATTMLQSIRFPMQKKSSSTNIEVSTQELNRLLNQEINISDLTIDDTKLSQHVISGEVQSDNLTGDLSLTSTAHIKSNERMKEEFRRDLSNVYSKYNVFRMVYRIMKNQLPQERDDNDIYKLYLSNKARINFQIAKAIETLERGAINSETIPHDYHIVEEVYYPEALATTERYPYEQRPDLSVEVTRSSGEEGFGDVLDDSENVLYWYKNLEYGNHYSIAYTVEVNGEQKIKLFFPDYIILTKDKRLLIVDVKAATNAEDYPYVQEKYDASQQFVSDHQEEFLLNNESYEPQITMAKKVEGTDDYFICMAEHYNTDFHDSNSWGDIKEVLKKQ